MESKVDYPYEVEARKTFERLRKDALANPLFMPIEEIIKSGSNVDPLFETERLFISVFNPKKNYETLDYSKTAIYLYKILVSPGALEKFLKLSKSHRVKIFDHISNIDSSSFLIGSYLDILEALGNPEPIFLIAGERLIRGFSEALKKTAIPAFPEQPSEASEKFRKLLNQLVDDHRYSNHQTAAMARTIVYSLRFLYGELVIIEILERNNTENFSLDVHDFYQIAKNYEKFREYPLRWSLELLDHS